MLDKIKLRDFFKLFNQNGYVMDFSNTTFDAFTNDSIGIEVQAEYNLSKGKSLESFLLDDNQEELLKIKLIKDLLNYYETWDIMESFKNEPLYNKCLKSINETKIDKIEINFNLDKKINMKYISDCYAKINKRFSSEEYDDVVGLARTLVEEVLCFIIEENNESPSEKGDLKKLYNQVKDSYKMNPKEVADKRIKEMLSGFEKILTSIASFRNIASSSHGVGSSRINLNKHTAKLYMNSSLTFCEYIYSVYENKLQ